MVDYDWVDFRFPILKVGFRLYIISSTLDKVFYSILLRNTLQIV